MPLSDPGGPPRGDPLSVRHLRSGLGARSLRGGAVTMLAQVAKTILQLGSVAVLARLLAPEAFGLVAMVAVVMMLLEQFKDLGLSTATVQREEITHGQISGLFWVNVALGIAVAAAACAMAPAVAAFYGHPELVPIMLWLAVGFVFSGLGTQHMALLRRQMRYPALAAVQLAAEVAGLGAAVIAALWGADYWSLVIQRLAWAVVLTAGAWLACGWRPGPPRRHQGLRALIGFGGNITGANLINFATRNLDMVLIGWWWGSAALGLYERSTKLLMTPLNSLNAPLFAVVMPALSRLAGEPQAYRRAYLNVLEKLVMTTTPFAAILVVEPEAVVRLVLGPGWSEAAPIVGWLGVAALYQPATYTCSWLFMSQDRSRDMLRWGVIGSTMTAVSIVAAVPFGPVAVAASYSLSGLLVRLPALFWMVGRRGPVSTLDLFRALLPSAAIGAVIILVVGQSHRIAALAALPAPASLGVALLAAAAIAMACFAAIPRSRRALVEMARMPAAMLHRERSA